MSRGIKIAIITLIIVLVIAGIIFLIWALLTRPPIIFKPAPIPPVEEPVTTLPTPGGAGTEVEIEPIPTEAELPFEIGASEEIEKQRALSLAVLFAERFGSFSNQGDFENLEDLMPLMTTAMKSWTRNYIAQGKAAQDADQPYYGISTKVLTSNIVFFDLGAGRAEIDVSTQRRESGAEIEERTFYQILNVVLLKPNDDWLVDEATWQ